MITSAPLVKLTPSAPSLLTSLPVNLRIEKQLQRDLANNRKLIKSAIVALSQLTNKIREMKIALHPMYRWACRHVSSQEALFYRLVAKMIIRIFHCWTHANEKIGQWKRTRSASSLDLKQLLNEKKSLELVLRVLKGSAQDCLNLKSRWRDLEWTSAWVKSCKPIQIKLMQLEGQSLRYASTHLRADLDVVINAVQNSAGAMIYASPHIRNDSQVMTALFYGVGEMPLALRGKLLSCASEEVKANRSQMLLALSKDGASLKHLSDVMRADKELVLTAMNSDGLALRFASLDLRGDREVVMAAIKQKPSAIIYASKELKDDPQIALSAVKKSGSVLRYLNGSLRNNFDIVLAAVTSEADVALIHASKALRGNKKILMQAMGASSLGRLLMLASDELKNDPEVVGQAVQFDPLSITYASKKLQKLPFKLWYK